MKRVPTVVVKSLLAGSVAASAVALAALAPSWQPAMAQQGPPITVSSTVPVEVSNPADLSTAAAFAWGEFIALTWPALPQGENGAFPRGQPDTSLKYGDKGKTGQVVWETFRHKSEAFPGQGVPNGFNPQAPDLGFSAQPDYVYKPAPANGIPASGRIPPLNPKWNPPFPPFHNLDEVSQIGLDGMYAGAVAPSPNASTSTNVQEKILFEAKVNQVVYQYVAQPRTTSTGQPYSYYQSDNTIVTNIQNNVIAYINSSGGQKPDPYISLPSSDPAAGKPGSIELKASFRRLGPKDNPANYYTAAVRYYRGDGNGKISGYVDSNDPTVNEVWGLTSLHIIQKTPNAPTFVYATFGHINNILDAAGNNVEETDGTTKAAYLNLPPFSPPLTITPSAKGNDQLVALAGNTPPVNTNSYQLYFHNMQGTISNGTGKYTLPVNVNRRIYPIPPPITAANRAAHGAIQAANANAVWLNYRLINVQARPLDIATITPNDEPTFYLSNEVVETNPTLQQFSGRLVGGDTTIFKGSRIVKNVRIVQPNGTITGYTMGGCMGCHGAAGQNLGGDFSVLLATGRVKGPDVIEIDENNAQVKRTLLRKYFPKKQ